MDETTTAPTPAFVAFAETLADAARAEALGWLERGASPDDKNEGGAFDPVTEADRAAERAMRALIEARFPDHGIAGEEYGVKAGQGPYGWSLDPIDGTRSFVCGLPSWTVLIALLEDEAPVLGVIDSPVLGERYIGHGDTAMLVRGERREALRVSGCRSLEEARLSTTDPFLFSGEEAARRFERVRERVRLTRYGHDAYAYARLAAGSLDLVIESGLKPHDYNALIPIVRGAGGVIGDWSGGEDFSAGAVVAAASRELFEEAVAALSD